MGQLRVAVVGAGLAGLAAADSLARAGVETVALEARDRVGGRVWSQRLRNGATIEMGAEFVLPGHDVLRGFVERFELGLWEKGMRYGDREPRGGIGVDPIRLHAATEAIGVALAVREDQGTAIAADVFLAGLDIDPGAREAIQARLEVSCADTADRVAAASLGGLAAHVADACPSVARGNQRIALELADGLGGAVRLSSPVEVIAWGGSDVRVSCGGVERSVDRVVLAVPASVVGRIRFEPALPAPLGDAFSAVTYGHAAKLFVPLAEVPSPSAVLSVPERYWTWTATGDDGVQPVVHAFAGSAPALEALGVAEGPERWLDSLVTLRSDLSLERAGAVLSTWDDDPWVGAAYSSSTPPVAAWEPCGPIHACGEHTAGPFSALMEGALRSGLRVAREILGSAPTGADPA